MKNLKLLALALAALAAAPAALADLMLYPTRVVIEKNQRAAQVEIVNRGNRPETYRIGIVDRRMTETGAIVAAGQALPDERFAGELLRHSPRQVTLQPGVAQTVRISVRKPAGLEAGEYRSHLQFDRVPDAAGASDLETALKAEQGQIGVVVQALIGASIPVIVRHGDTTVNATLAELAVEPAAAQDKPPLLAFVIRREGTRSVYGDLVAEFTPAGGRPVEVAKVSGVAVYVPNPLRRARLALKPPEGTALEGGTLSLRYSERPEAGGRVIAQAELVLP